MRVKRAKRKALVTVENKEIPPGRTFRLECKLSVKAFICKRNKSGPRMQHSGTPALMSAHEKYWPFKTTLGFLLLRKSVK